MATTRNKITLSPSIDYVARFTMGDKERKAADDWHAADKSEVGKALAFYRTVLKAHDIAPTSLRKPDGRARTNEEAASYDFTQMAFFRAKLGAACADAMADPKVEKATILKPSGLTATGGTIKPQSKGALRTSYGGGKTWGVFLTRMEAFYDAEQGGEEPSKAKPVASSDKEFAVKSAGALIKRMRKAVEKQDGSMSPEAMKTFAAWVEDGLKAVGIK